MIVNVGIKMTTNVGINVTPHVHMYMTPNVRMYTTPNVCMYITLSVPPMFSGLKKVGELKKSVEVELCGQTLIIQQNVENSRLKRMGELKNEAPPPK